MLQSGHIHPDPGLYSREATEAIPEEAYQHSTLYVQESTVTAAVAENGTNYVNNKFGLFLFYVLTFGFSAFTQNLLTSRLTCFKHTNSRDQKYKLTSVAKETRQ